MVDSWPTLQDFQKALENDPDGLVQGYIDACRTGADSGRKYLEGLDMRQQIQLKKRLGYTPEMLLADFLLREW